MSGSCVDCLRHGHLIGRLAPRIAALTGRPRGENEPPRAPLLALPDEELISAVCASGTRAREERAVLERFDAERAEARLAAVGVDAICSHSPLYPPALGDLEDPPAVLFVAGGAERFAGLTRERVVAVVGSRQASPYGLDMARAIGRGLAAGGVVVVSGLALGIDAAAHRGAVSLPGAGVIAVLARGPERTYPKTNGPLYRRIREIGSVVSEFPPGVGVYRWSFPARNRIMAALAEGTIVVEAADPSGSLITARFAAQLGRFVGAVPGRATARGARGSNLLLQDGAHVVMSAADVLDQIFGVRNHPAPPSERPPLDPTLERVLDAVEACDRLDEVTERTGLRAGEVRGALARLELLGLVARDALGAYRRSPD